MNPAAPAVEDGHGGRPHTRFGEAGIETNLFSDPTPAGMIDAAARRFEVSPMIHAEDFIFHYQSGETLTFRHDVEKLGDRGRPDAERGLERPFVGRDQADHEDDASGENDHGGDLGARLIELHYGKADLRH